MKKILTAIMTGVFGLSVCLMGAPRLLAASAAEPSHEHTLTYFAVSSPSHTTDGYYAHYYCETCDIYFDTTGTQCTKKSLAILALGHLNAQKVAEKAATTCENGNIQYWYCSTCDGKFAGTAPRAKEYADEEIVIPATGHALSFVEEVAATAEKEGMGAHWACSACERCFSDAEGQTEVSKDSLVIEKLPPVDEETSSSSSSDEEISSDEISSDEETSMETNSSSEETPSEVGGCTGSVGGVALISALLGGIAICVKKRKNSD